MVTGVLRGTLGASMGSEKVTKGSARLANPFLYRSTFKVRNMIKVIRAIRVESI